MVLFPSWIPWSHPRQTIPHLLQYTANPPTLTSTFSGIAITIYLLSTVSLVPLPIGPIQCAPHQRILNEELEHLREALVRCKYPRWAINKIQNQYNNNNQEEIANNTTTNQGEDSTLGPNRNTCTEVYNNNNNNNNNSNRPNAGQIVVPYVQGLGKNLKKICSRHGVQTHFKGSTIIRQMLVRPKHKDTKDCQSNVIYIYQCKEVNCDEEYIGETSRTLGERYREHLKEPSPIHAHSIQTGHSANEDNFSILGRGGPGPNQVNQRIHLH